MNRSRDARGRPADDDPRPTPRRERQTLIPSFDPAELAKDIEETSQLPTKPPPFDPASYARIVDQHVTEAVDRRETPRTLIAAPPAAPEEASVPSVEVSAEEHAISLTDVDTIGRAMYGSYLESDFPEALVLAERVLEQQPDHALAQLVAERCRAVLEPTPAPRLLPSSVVRVRSSPSELAELVLDAKSERVLEQIDGVADLERIAQLSGVPRHEALDRLHALIDLGVVEVLSA
jgi:hypothetical protein